MFKKFLRWLSVSWKNADAVVTLQTEVKNRQEFLCYVKRCAESPDEDGMTQQEAQNWIPVCEKQLEYANETLENVKKQGYKVFDFREYNKILFGFLDELHDPDEEAF